MYFHILSCTTSMKSTPPQFIHINQWKDLRKAESADVSTDKY